MGRALIQVVVVVFLLNISFLKHVARADSIEADLAEAIGELSDDELQAVEQAISSSGGDQCYCPRQSADIGALSGCNGTDPHTAQNPQCGDCQGYQPGHYESSPGVAAWDETVTVIVTPAVYRTVGCHTSQGCHQELVTPAVTRTYVVHHPAIPPGTPVLVPGGTHLQPRPCVWGVPPTVSNGGASNGAPCTTCGGSNGGGNTGGGQIINRVVNRLLGGLHF